MASFMSQQVQTGIQSLGGPVRLQVTAEPLALLPSCSSHSPAEHKSSPHADTLCLAWSRQRVTTENMKFLFLIFVGSQFSKWLSYLKYLSMFLIFPQERVVFTPKERRRWLFTDQQQSPLCRALKSQALFSTLLIPRFVKSHLSLWSRWHHFGFKVTLDFNSSSKNHRIVELKMH